MKTLKEKWIEVLPALLSIVCILLIVFLFIWGLSKIIKPHTQEELVNQIKLCQQNDLDTYQAENGNWYCKPKTK